MKVILLSDIKGVGKKDQIINAMMVMQEITYFLKI